MLRGCYRSDILRVDKVMSVSTSKSATDRARDWLASGDVRPTKQRLALAELLVGDGNNRHVTAEGLFDAASDEVSLATVYNTLRAFCEAGLMTEITVGGNCSYFDTRTDDHHHYFWEEDGTLTDAPSDAVELAALPKAPRWGRDCPR